MDSVFAASHSVGNCDSYCGQRVLPSNPLRVGYAQRGACLVPLNATEVRGEAKGSLCVHMKVKIAVTMVEINIILFYKPKIFYIFYCKSFS